MPGKAFLDTLLKTAAEGIVVHDAAGRIIFCDSAAEAMLGLGQIDLVGCSCEELKEWTIREDGRPFPPSEDPAMITLLTGLPCRNVVMGICHDPAMPVRWISINSALIPAEGGNEPAVFAVFSDITLHIEDKQRLARLTEELWAVSAYRKAILFKSPVSISVYNTGWICIQANGAFANIFGTDPASLIGTSAGQLYRTKQKFEEVSRKICSIVSQGKLFKADVPMRRLNGTRIWIRLVAAPVDSNVPQLGTIVTTEDVTAELREASELRRTSATLGEIKTALELKAVTDVLTGLPNRRKFNAVIEKRFNHFKDNGKFSYAVLIIDIDHFKKCK